LETTPTKTPNMLVTELEFEGNKFSAEDFVDAFEARKDQVLSIVSMDNCGALPYPEKKHRKSVAIGRRILYTPKTYKRMLLRILK